MPMSYDDRSPGAVQSFWSVDAPQVERTRSTLLAVLASVDLDGWDGPAATALLTYVRHELVRPLTIAVGLRGAAASQAEATAWEAVWLKLCDPHLRSSHSPWGLLWQTARRAVLGELFAARWGTGARRAWDHHVEERTGGGLRPISLEALLDRAFEPMQIESPVPCPSPSRVSRALGLAVGALVDAGWDTGAAKQIVAEVAAMEDALGHGATVVGWRPLAARLGLPPWQARRLTLVLRGSVEQPGLLARLITGGPGAADAPDVREALIRTRDRRPPSSAARRRSHAPERLPQRVAS